MDVAQHMYSILCLDTIFCVDIIWIGNKEFNNSEQHDATRLTVYIHK